MGIRAELLRFYFEIESKYYELCDTLDEKGISIYESFVTPVEKKGYPSFPFAVIFILLVATVAAFAIFTIVPSVIAGNRMIYVKVIGDNSMPVPGASVELLTANHQVVASGLTNATGELFLSSSSAALQLKVTHPDYLDASKPISDSVIVRLDLKSTYHPRQNQPTSSNQSGLNANGQSGSPSSIFFKPPIDAFIDSQQFGSIQVNLVDKTAGAKLNGTVKVFDAVTDNEIASVQSVNGIAVFENLALNQHIYVYSRILGFSSNKSSEIIVKRERQNIDIVFEAVPFLNTTISIISSLTKQPLSGVYVVLYDADNVELKNYSTTSSGNFTVELAINKQYFVSAKKDAFLTKVSPHFSSNTSNVVVELLPATPDVVSTLTVNFEDEYAAPIEGIVSIYSEDNVLIEKKPVKRASHEFTYLPRNSTVIVKGSASDLSSEKTVLLNDSHVTVTLSMELRFANFSFNAVDALTNALLTGINVSVKRNGESFATCIVPCDVRVKTRGFYEFNFSNPNYFDYVQSLGSPSSLDSNTLEENSLTQVNASMMSLESVRDTRVVLNGVYDAATNEKISSTSALMQNRVYLASVSGYFANAREAHVFFTPSADSQQPILLNFTPFPNTIDAPSGLEARASISSTRSDCGPLLSGSDWKRVLLSMPRNDLSSFSQGYSFYFVAQAPDQAYSSRQYTNLSLAMSSTIKRGEEYIRNPFDQLLGVSPIQFNGASSQCSANAYNYSFQVASPNSVYNDQGMLTLNFEQNRNPIADVNTGKPVACGVISESPNFTDRYSTFDCNGFPVDSGLANPLSAKINIQLNHNVKGGILKFQSNPEFFLPTNESFTIGGFSPFLRNPVPPSAVFETELLPSQFGTGGSTQISSIVNLSAFGSAPRTEIIVEFTERFENGSLSNQKLTKSIWVSVSPVEQPSSLSLLTGPCSDQTRFNYTYDDKLLSTGSGWSGCSTIPLIVDPIFPADAVPIYIENSTGVGDCRTSETQTALMPLSEGSVTQDALAANGQNCFDLKDDMVADLNDFKGYALRFNAVKCGNVVGNKVTPVNASLKLVCNRATGQSPLDVKDIKITVTVANNENLKNLVFGTLESPTDIGSNSSSASLELYALVDNLQIRPDATNPSSPRSLSFSFLYSNPVQVGADKVPTVDGLPVPAYALVENTWASGVLNNINESGKSIFDNPAQAIFNFTAHSRRPQVNGALLLNDTLRPKPLLEYVQNANNIRLITAFRRSLNSNYYCERGVQPSFDPTRCRPTLNDWITTVENPAYREEPCTACRAGTNCDSTCNATTGKKPDGSLCFNWCDAPVCEKAPACNPTTNKKKVPIPGRATQVWLNHTTLSLVPLIRFSQDETAALDLTDAPFKYFASETGGTFNYTYVARLGSSCNATADSILGYTDTGCFVDSGSRAVLEKYTPIPRSGVPFFTSGSTIGTIKFREEDGGCVPGNKPSYFRLTFSYYRDSSSGQMKWIYVADPLQVSSAYLQDDTSQDRCDSPSPGTGRFSKLCYSWYSTTMRVGTERAGQQPAIGYCLRSLRDYIPENANDKDDARGDTTKLNGVPYESVKVLKGEGLNLPAGVVLPNSLMQNFTDENLYFRNMEVKLSSSDFSLSVPLCPFFGTNSQNGQDYYQQQIFSNGKPYDRACIGGSYCNYETFITPTNSGPYHYYTNKTTKSPLLPSTNLRPTKLGLTKNGELDWLNKVDVAIGINEDAPLSSDDCRTLAHRADGPVKNKMEFDGVYDGEVVVKYKQINANGIVISPPTDQKCFVGCYLETASCPYIFSFDGSDYKFEHEGFPQSGLKNEEDYSYSPLNFLKPQNGTLKLRSLETKQEVSFTNVVKVFAVDYKNANAIMPDLNGAPHTMKQKIYAYRAIDQDDVDVTNYVNNSDGIYWQDNSRKPINFAELHFAALNNFTTVKLNVQLRKSGSLNAKLNNIRSLIGKNYQFIVNDFLDAVPHELFTFVYDNWVKRKMTLAVKVKQGNEWRDVGAIRVAEDTSRLVYFTVPESGSLIVRLETAGGAYNIDEVYADFSPDEEMQVTQLDLQTAIDGNGVDVAKQIARDDELRYSQYKRDHVEMEFKDAHEKIDDSGIGYKRGYILAIKGYSIPFASNNQTLEGFVTKALPIIGKGIFDPNFGTRTKIAK